jgi:hypothetical protein
MKEPTFAQLLSESRAKLAHAISEGAAIRVSVAIMKSRSQIEPAVANERIAGAKKVIEDALVAHDDVILDALIGGESTLSEAKPSVSV